MTRYLLQKLLLDYIFDFHTVQHSLISQIFIFLQPSNNNSWLDINLFCKCPDRFFSKAPPGSYLRNHHTLLLVSIHFVKMHPHHSLIFESIHLFPAQLYFFRLLKGPLSAAVTHAPIHGITQTKMYLHIFACHSVQNHLYLCLAILLRHLRRNFKIRKQYQCHSATG